MEIGTFIANVSIETMSSALLRTDDESLLNDINYFSSLSDDELDIKFYFYLYSFMECFLFYICNPSFALTEHYRLIFQKLMVLSTIRFKRGLISFPDSKEDDIIK